MDRITGEQTRNQQGVFTIEFALIASFITIVLVFISDMASRQTTQGQLQRLSYSGVTVIKERTQLYGSARGEMTFSQANQLFDILKQSMMRTIGGFEPNALGMHVEQVIFNKAGDCSDASDDDRCRDVSFSPGASGCMPETLLRSRGELFLETSWGNPVSLYQVTLCYKGGNWYGNLIGEDYSRLKSTSLMVGR